MLGVLTGADPGGSPISGSLAAIAAVSQSHVPKPNNPAYVETDSSCAHGESTPPTDVTPPCVYSSGPPDAPGPRPDMMSYTPAVLEASAKTSASINPVPRCG